MSVVQLPAVPVASRADALGSAPGVTALSVAPTVVARALGEAVAAPAEAVEDALVGAGAGVVGPHP
jgi:hypothetical protein